MERTALDDEIERLHSASFGWALSCCGWNRQEAEDVLQTAYLKVLDGRARYGGRSAVRTWLFAVIRTTAAEGRRRRWIRGLLLGRWLMAEEAPEQPRPEEILRERDRGARVRAALARLAVRQREVLDLVFFHGLTVEEAAGAMGVSPGTARMHYARGKRRLLVLLAPEELP